MLAATLLMLFIRALFIDVDTYTPPATLVTPCRVYAAFSPMRAREAIRSAPCRYLPRTRHFRHMLIRRYAADRW